MCIHGNVFAFCMCVCACVCTCLKPIEWLLCMRWQCSLLSEYQLVRATLSTTCHTYNYVNLKHSFQYVGLRVRNNLPTETFPTVASELTGAEPLKQKQNFSRNEVGSSPMGWKRPVGSNRHTWIRTGKEDLWVQWTQWTGRPRCCTGTRDNDPGIETDLCV